MKKFHWAILPLFPLLLLACTHPADLSDQTCFTPTHRTSWKADDYGMKPFVMAFLKSGPNRSQSPDERNALQQAHMANIERMAAAGQLVLTGPFLDGGDIRGIYVFNTADTAEARVWTATDPAIEAGSLSMELHPWYGSAALMAINDLHNLIQLRGITEE